MSHFQDAFDQVCTEAVQAQGFYVVLMQRVPYYGGPEEGGWWGSDTHISAYQYFPTEVQAKAAKEQIEKLAYELSKEAKKAYGDRCLRETEWLDARGLDDSYLPEVSGSEEYYVLMCEELPVESRGCRQYS